MGETPDTERILGRLEEFKDWSKSEMRYLNKRLMHISKQVDELNQARWVLKGQLVVGTSVVVTMVSILIRKIFGVNV